MSSKEQSIDSKGDQYYLANNSLQNDEVENIEFEKSLDDYSNHENNAERNSQNDNYITEITKDLLIKEGTDHKLYNNLEGILII